MKRTLLALLGIPVMLLGLAGWILPLIPGFPIFLVGLAMIIGWHPKGRKLVDNLREKGRSMLVRTGMLRRSKDSLAAELFVEEGHDRSNKQ